MPRAALRAPNGAPGSCGGFAEAPAPPESRATRRPGEGRFRRRRDRRNVVFLLRSGVSRIVATIFHGEGTEIHPPVSASVAGSIRQRLAERTSTTHTAPSPATIPTGLRRCRETATRTYHRPALLRSPYFSCRSGNDRARDRRVFSRSSRDASPAGARLDPASREIACVSSRCRSSSRLIVRRARSSVWRHRALRH